MIESIMGVNGGYRLKQNWGNTPPLDIIRANEGSASLFDCSFDHRLEYPIQKVVLSAEEKMEEQLRNQKMSDVRGERLFIKKCFEKL